MGILAPMCVHNLDSTQPPIKTSGAPTDITIKQIRYLTTTKI